MAEAALPPKAANRDSLDSAAVEKSEKHEQPIEASEPQPDAHDKAQANTEADGDQKEEVEDEQEDVEDEQEEDDEDDEDEGYESSDEGNKANVGLSYLLEDVSLASMPSPPPLLICSGSGS